MVSVILPAAGRGKRMKAGINKVFLELMGEPILCHTLRAFAALPEVQELIVVTGRDEVEPLCRLLANRTVLGSAEDSKSIKVVEGGSERQYSVWNGLKASSAESDVVLVHDAARPLVSRATIEAVIAAARQYGAAIAAVPEGMREVFLLRDVHGLSVEETAQALQIAQGTVKSRLARAREKIAAELKQRGVGQTGGERHAV